MEQSDKNSPAAALSEVSWQTLFWTLVPLAVNVMAQPSGRVCGTLSMCRTYLRSSPIICAADTLSILIRCLLYGLRSISPFTTLRLPFNDCVRLIIDARFSDMTDDSRTLEGIQVLENMTWLRWLFFLLGSLGPAIKMMSFQGTPWSKAWGVMFLCDFAMVEVLVILSWIYPPEIRFLSRKETAVIRRSEFFLRRVDRVLIRAALLFHAGLLFTIAADTWPTRLSRSAFDDLPQPSLELKRCYRAVTLFFEAFRISLIAGCLHLFFHPISDEGRPSIASTRRRIKNINRIVAFVVLLVTTGYTWAWWPGFKMILMDMVFVLCFVGPAYIFDGFCNSLFIGSQRLGQGLLLVPRLKGPGPHHVEARASLSFVNFVYSIVLCILWYSLRYNAAGTMNPGWTGIFG